MTSVEDRLKDIESQVAGIRSELAPAEELPVGSVIAATSAWGLEPIAFKVSSIHSSYSGGRAVTDKPVWVTIFGDFSGDSFPSLAALQEKHNCFRKYKVLREGNA